MNSKKGFQSDSSRSFNLTIRLSRAKKLPEMFNSN